MARQAKGGPVYALTIGRRSELLVVIDAMLPHLIVKRAAAIKLREFLGTISDASPNVGKVAAVPSEQLQAWYDGEGLSHAQIAERLGVSRNAVVQAFRRRGLPTRKAGGAHMKGVPKSTETRQRMKDSRRKMWEDPAFRASQMVNLSKGAASVRRPRPPGD